MMNGKYRLNAGSVVFNKKGKVLLFERKALVGEWQFPQGGIEPGETPQDASFRELKEETNIHSVIEVASYPHSLRYDFPPEILEKFKQLGRKNIGQEQYWFLFYFTGEESEIDFETFPEEIEFRAYKWADFSEAVEGAVSFKKEVYQKIAEYFEPIIDSYIKKLS